MYNDKQQQAVILKGIAHQILNMNMPSVGELIKLLRQFGFTECQTTPKYIVLTCTDEVQGTNWIETPFVDRFSATKLRYCKFESLKAANEIAFMNAKSYASEVAKVDKELSTITENAIYASSYGYHDNYHDAYDVIKYCYVCNGRWWAVIENPSWI